MTVTHTHTHTHTRTHTYTHTDRHTHTHRHAHTCTHTHIHVHTHTHIHTYTHMCTHRQYSQILLRIRFFDSSLPTSQKADQIYTESINLILHLDTLSTIESQESPLACAQELILWHNETINTMQVSSTTNWQRNMCGHPPILVACAMSMPDIISCAEPNGDWCDSIIAKCPNAKENWPYV